MKFLELIEKKKKSIPLTIDEYDFMINGIVNNEIPDYQVTSFLMATYFNNMNDDELFAFTKSIMNYSLIIKPIANNTLNISIDKHSSGGVGDKVSLILSPILSAIGYDVVKLSGRGLSFTGGTVDKLESIGITCEYNKDNFQKLLDNTHFTLMLQTNDIVPGDKKIYDLRNASATVDCLPLIASSIMSKKLVIETDYIFLDIKIGDGAFFKTIEDGENFAKLAISIANKFNRKLIIHLTSMSQPLGRTIGNAIEVKEALEFLQGNFKSKILKELIYNFIIDILIDTNVCSSKIKAEEIIDSVIKNRKAYNSFLNFVEVFNGDLEKVKNNTYFQPKYKFEIYSNNNGYIRFKSTSKVGLIANLLGAGRFNKEDKIDNHAGIELFFDPNDYVEKNKLIAILYSSNPIKNEIIEQFNLNIEISKNSELSQPIILEKISN